MKLNKKSIIDGFIKAIFFDYFVVVSTSSTTYMVAVPELVEGELV